MWPSQRIQHMLLRRSTGQDELTGNISDPGWNARANTGTTSKIEIRHTRLFHQAGNPGGTNESSLSYISGVKDGRHVTFAPSALRASSPGVVSSPRDRSQENSLAASREGVTDLRKDNQAANEHVGQMAIQALCNRSSVLDIIGGDRCACSDSLNSFDEIERIQQLDPETQKEELYKLVIRLAEEREKRNRRLVALRARQVMFYC